MKTRVLDFLFILLLVLGLIIFVSQFDGLVPRGLHLHFFKYWGKIGNIFAHHFNLRYTFITLTQGVS